MFLLTASLTYTPLHLPLFGQLQYTVTCSTCFAGIADDPTVCQRLGCEAVVGKADKGCHLHPSAMEMPSSGSQVWCSLPGHLAPAGLDKRGSC